MSKMKTIIVALAITLLPILCFAQADLTTVNQAILESTLQYEFNNFTSYLRAKDSRYKSISIEHYIVHVPPHISISDRYFLKKFTNINPSVRSDSDITCENEKCHFIGSNSTVGNMLFFNVRHIKVIDNMSAVARIDVIFAFNQYGWARKYKLFFNGESWSVTSVANNTFSP